MSKPFNELTPAQAERLAMLIEECAEVQQIACKILRHGYGSFDPDDETKGTNRTQLQVELADLVAIQTIMQSYGAQDVRVHTQAELQHAIERKFMYAHHQGRKS